MRSLRFRNLLIAGYVTFQVLYPIRGLVEDKFDTFGEFTWNMYSQTYRCTTRYAVVDSSGSQPITDFRKYFNSPSEVSRVFHRDALPRFHKFLCAQLAAEGGRSQLRGFVECTKNDAESEILVGDIANICAAPNYAVTAN